MAHWTQEASATACILVVLGAFLPSCPLQAAEGLYLTWSECAASGLGTRDLSSSCASDAGEQSLFCAFTLPQALDSVIALEIVLDLQHSDPKLPPWWRFEEGGCRLGALVVSEAFPAGSPCVDPWQGIVPAAVLADYVVGGPGRPPSQARIRITYSVPSGNYRALNSSDMYFAARLVLGNQGTMSCSGCQPSACLVLNSILIGRLPGPGGESQNLSLQVPGAGDANQATWRGTGANCGAVPARAMTWGRIKSHYR